MNIYLTLLILRFKEIRHWELNLYLNINHNSKMELSYILSLTHNIKTLFLFISMFQHHLDQMAYRRIIFLDQEVPVSYLLADNSWMSCRSSLRRKDMVHHQEQVLAYLW